MIIQSRADISVPLAGVGWRALSSGAHDPGGRGGYWVENLYMMVFLYICPGRSTTDGKVGLLGESG